MSEEAKWEGAIALAYRDGQQSRQPKIDALRAALDESVKLQSHYADLLNMYDGGQRIIFKSTEEWLERLTALESKGNPNAPKT